MVSEIRFYFLLSNISFEDIVNLIDKIDCTGYLN